MHLNSFQSESGFASQLPAVKPLDRGVRVHRWIENTFGSATRRSDVAVDAFQTYDFLVPGILLMWSANFPVGTARAAENGPVFAEQSIGGLGLTCQAVTPMTKRAARYFFRFGPYKRHGDEKLRDAMMATAQMAFGEDRTMIEAQQRLIDLDPGRRIMPTAHDRAATIYAGIVRRLDDHA